MLHPQMWFHSHISNIFSLKNLTKDLSILLVFQEQSVDQVFSSKATNRFSMISALLFLLDLLYAVFNPSPLELDIQLINFFF